jgi:hypothetical protein
MAASEGKIDIARDRSKLTHVRHQRERQQQSSATLDFLPGVAKRLQYPLGDSAI